MPQDPLAPIDDGHVGMPSIDAGMNKIAPTARDGGRGARDENPMMRPPRRDREESDEELLKRARKRFTLCDRAETDNRKRAVEDLRFKVGDQWPAEELARRSVTQRPALTLNKIPTFVNQVTNDQRQNRPAINVSPIGDRSDPEVAKMYRGLIREIERDSQADIAYDTGFESAVSNGFGYWRIVLEFESPKSFNQVPVIKRVRNPMTVYLDPYHTEPDGSDARFGFITEMIDREDFKEQYPGADPISWTPTGIADDMKDWANKDSVRVAEYFEITYDKRTVVKLANGAEGWKDEMDPGELDRNEILRERESEDATARWYKITGTEILEETPWPIADIPIIKCTGEEIDIEGKLILSGIIRRAKDPQRMYNYWSTAATEAIALAPKAKWVLEEGQIEGHEDEWRTANNSPDPYLTYKATDATGKPSPPPQRLAPEPVPAAIMTGRQSAAEDMMATTGIRFDATPHERMYDESGRALRELRRSGDIGTFHYIDNLARALRRTGQILVHLIPKVYDTRRVVTILREDGSEELVHIDPNAPKPMAELRDTATQKARKIFNPTIGKYGVTVTIGPSYATKRIEAAESMMDFVRAMPQAGQLIMDLIAKNQDWEGADEIAARLAKALPPGMLVPETKDIPPQVQAILQGMQQQLQQMTQERAALMKTLMDQQADRAQRQDKIDKDFEAKLIGVVQKAEAAYATHVGSQLKDLAEGVQLLRDTLAEPPKQKPGSANA